MTTPKIVNLTLEFDQQKQFFVRRIEFSGNTTTRDKVIRRELLLDEGQVFNNRLWELSILRLNQLGLFRHDQAGKCRIEAQRQGRHGRHQAEGEGKGQAIDQLLGRRQRNCRQFRWGFLSDQQFPGPRRNAHAFGASRQHSEQMPLSASPSRIYSTVRFRPDSPFFTRKFDYNTARQEGLLVGQQVAIDPALQENYNTDSRGFTIFASYPLRKFSFARLGVSYGWSTTNITPFSQSAHSALRIHEVHQPGRPFGFEWHPAEPNHSDDHLQHRGQPALSHARKELLLRSVFCGRAARRQRQHDQQYF